MNDRRHTAIHEAGHAVIGRVLTMACGGATITADDDSAGHSITADPNLILSEWDRRGKWRGTAGGGNSELERRHSFGATGVIFLAIQATFSEEHRGL